MSHNPDVAQVVQKKHMDICLQWFFSQEEK